MSKIIKDLNTFSDEVQLNEDFSWGGLISGAFNFASTGLRKTVKEKIAAIILEQIGIKQDSLFSGIVQEAVDAIPIKDYPALITGEKANIEYLAPKMAQAISEFFERKGFDPIAEQMGIDSKGWLYSTIRNGLQSPEGKERLKSMLIEAFGGKDAKGSVARDAISDLPKEDKQKISDEVKKKLGIMYGKKVEMEPEKKGDYISDFWSSLLGSSAK